MPKEMIVSVNGREKKIAVIDNGLVTEFYIERGEGGDTGAGIVGNIYKGRVQRVLPGMQSAFVDIGLERDAFLYVSDFFDEEEDVERVAITTKNVANAENAALTAGAREPAQVASSASLMPAAPAIVEDRSERDAEPDGSRRRRGRGRGRDTARDGERTRDDNRDGASRTPRDRDAISRPEMRQDAAPLTETSAAQSDAMSDVTSERPLTSSRIDVDDDDAPQTNRRPQSRSTEFVRPEPVRPEEIATPFVAPADFERIDDPEESSETAGDLLKDAIIQDRLTDQTRRVEFDLPAQTPHTIGSLLETSVASAPASFERISDDEADAQAEADAGRTTPKVVAAKALFQDAAVEDDSAPAPLAGTSFERISDDEGTPSADAAAPAKQTPVTAAADDGTRTRRTRSRRGGGKQEPTEAVAATTTDDATAGTPIDAVSETTSTEDAAGEPEAASGRKRRGTNRAGAKAAGEPAANRSRRTRRTEATADAAADPDAAQTAGDSAESGDLFADADASVKGSSARGEFARRRRRGGRRPNDGTTGENGDGEEGDSAASDLADAPGAIDSDAGEDADLAMSSAKADDDDDVFAPIIIDDDVSDMIAAQETIAETNGADADGANISAPNANGGSDFGAHRGISGTTLNPGANSGGGGDNRRGSRDNRERSDSRSGAGRERRPAPPAISDLLREGQEVLVQIAKEPIATKGARITSHVALPGRFLVYMPTVEHVGVSRKIESDSERQRLRKMITTIRKEEDVPSGGFIVRTAGTNITELDLREDARYLVRTWRDIRRSAERAKSPALVHKDLDLVQRLLRDQLSEEFAAIRVDSEEEYLQVVEFVNRIQPRLVNRVKLHTRDEPIMETYGVQAEIDKAIKPRVWLKSGGYLVINQTEALVAIDVNTGKFVGRGGSRLEDTITRTNMEAVDEIARQIRLRDLGGIIVLDLIDMEERRNRARVMDALQHALEDDKSPTKVLSFNDFGLVIMTRKRVKQSLERTLCSPCPYCTGAGLVKSPQTVAYEILDEARRLARGMKGDKIKQTTLRVHPEVARALRSTERDVLTEIEDHLGAVDVTSDEGVHQEQFDFAII